MYCYTFVSLRQFWDRSNIVGTAPRSVERLGKGSFSLLWPGGWDGIKHREHGEKGRQGRGKIICSFNMLRMRCALGPEAPFWSERWEPEKLFCELVGLLSEHRRHFVIILFIKLSGPPARPGAPVAGTVRIWLPPVFLASRQHVVNPPMNVSEKASPLSYAVQKWWKS